MEELTEYERQRRANIEANRAMMRKLQLDAGIDMKIKPAPIKTSHKRKRPLPTPKVEIDNTPRRTSSRLRGIVADSEVAQRKAEDEHEALQQAERAKRVRVSGDFSLKDAVVVGREWNSASNTFDGLEKWWTYKPSFTDRDIKATTDVDLRKMREKMNGLKLYEDYEPNEIKITPERIYCMTFNPNTVKPLVFAGDKTGNMGIFDASQSRDIKKEDAGEDDDDEGPNISSFKLHTRTITTLQFDPSHINRVYSASHDGSVRALDLLSGQTTEVFAPRVGEEDPISCCEISIEDPNLLHVTTLNGAFAKKDMREPTSAIQWYQLSEKKIGGFSLNPARPYLVATASLDRTVPIWDLRKVSAGKNKMPHLVGMHESRLSISASNWNSLGQIVTTSYDNTIKVYDFSKTVATWKPGTSLEEEQLKPKHVISHNNQTGRWVTILKATWQQRPEDGKHKFCIGNMNRFVDIYSADGQQLAQLADDAITAVPAVAVFHPTKDWIVAGTASGKVCLWM